MSIIGDNLAIGMASWRFASDEYSDIHFERLSFRERSTLKRSNGGTRTEHRLHDVGMGSGLPSRWFTVSRSSEDAGYLYSVTHSLPRSRSLQ